MGKPNIIFN